MTWLVALYGPPHEMLHVLALLIVGRRAGRVSGRHVDIPDDLTTAQFVFVAALPTVVFLMVAALGLVGVVSAQTLTQAMLAFAAGLLGMGGVAGGSSDLQRIAERLEGQ
jgi:hypothetical protein